MSRLKHPVRGIREPFGTAGLIVAIVALVFALVGGAYAAGGGLTGKQKKEVKAIAKSFQGIGPAGPVGPAGANGAKGDTGAAGQNGAAGTNGSNGKPVATATEPPGAHCAEGGFSAEVEGLPATKKYACNGANGSPGPAGAPGSPWTAGGTLPVGSSEKGTWSVTGGSEDSFGIVASISFGIPLANELEAGHTIFVPSPSIGPNPDEVHCPGTVEEPEATSGYLCVYQSLSTGSLSFTSFVFTSKVGTNLRFAATAEGQLSVGTWAVTG